MELKSRSFTSKDPQVAREPQVADPCPIQWVPLGVFSGDKATGMRS
jgi:hypothetical protein